MSESAPLCEDFEALKSRFFEGMSLAAATVNVVTTDGTSGRAGVTVSAMSSVSADTTRPTLLVCVNENSAAAEAILENGVFCVNVLRDHQSFISDAFAGRYKDQLSDKFECTEWETSDLGVPRVADALVAFDCKIVSIKKVGTHHVCFGEVEDIHLGRNGSALIYANRAYGSAARIETSTAQFTDGASQADPVRIGCFHTFAPFIIPKCTAALKRSGIQTGLDLIEGDLRRLRDGLFAGEIDLAFMFEQSNGNDLDFTPLFDLHPYVLVAEDHPLTEKTIIEPKDLDGLDMVSVREEASRDMLEGALRKAGVNPNVTCRATSFEMARGMVGHGLGFAILMTKPAASVTYDGVGVVSRELAMDLAPGRIGLVSRKNDLNKASQLAHQICVDLFQNNDG